MDNLLRGDWYEGSRPGVLEFKPTEYSLPDFKLVFKQGSSRVTFEDHRATDHGGPPKRRRRLGIPRSHFRFPSLASKYSNERILTPPAALVGKVRQKMKQVLQGKEALED